MYRCFTDTEEAELTDDCAQSYFDFFHGKSHADTVTRPHSKRKKSVRVTFSFVIGAPPVSEIVHMVTIMVKKKITSRIGRHPGSTMVSRRRVNSNNFMEHHLREMLSEDCVLSFRIF